MNSLQSHEKSDRVKWIAVAIAILLLLGAVGAAFGLGAKHNGWFSKPADDSSDGGAQIEDGSSHGISLTSVQIPREKFAEYGIATIADSADTYKVPAEDIANAMKYITEQLEGDKVLRRYSRDIFESVAGEYTEVNWTVGDNFDLRKDTITRSFWQRLFGGMTVETEIFDGINAIYPVKAEDLKGSIKDVCQRLYISEGDYAAFTSYFNDPENMDSTVYLFRYRVTDYISQEATLIDNNAGDFLYPMGKEIDTNAYFFQESVDLGFDIIDVTFSNGEKETVIPVAMEPKDIIPSATAPLVTNTDKYKNLWKFILGVILLILLVVLLAPVLPYIIKAVVWIIMLPFRAIAAIVKAVRRAKDKKK